MCGLIAVVTPNRPFGCEQIDTMRDRIAHRGPDGRGAVVIDDPVGAVGLGHRRLSIIDLSAAAAQPMASACGRATVVYNGEIFNYVELREELKRAGRRFRTSSDTEVLLEAYLHWGAECLPRLNGQFGFALWDAQLRELLVARDRFGEKPLYYAPVRGGGMAFSSEIKALLAHPGIDARMDEEMLAASAVGATDFFSDRTYFAGVRKLRPAHALFVRADGSVSRHWCYWRPDFEAPRLKMPLRDIVEEFAQRLEASVRMRLRSDVRVAACLSGGLDSSSIVALLAKIWSERGVLADNVTLSVRFDRDPTTSEGRYIDQVVERTGVRALMVEPDPQRLAEEFALMHWHHEEPGLTGSHYNEWCLMRRAREAGCIVMLDGQGADEVLGGYQYYFRLYQQDLVFRRQWGALLANTAMFRGRMRREARRYQQAERRFNKDIAFGLRQLYATFRSAPRMDGPLHPGLPAFHSGGFFRHQLAIGLLYDQLPRQLHSADRNAMAFGVESRFPFLDHELVDWCLRLPEHALIRNGWQKYVLRRALDGRLPRDVSWRVDKVGYAAPQDRWLRGPLRTWAEAMLFERRMRNLPSYDERKLRAVWEEHQAGTANHEGALWTWLSIGQFSRLFEEGAWRSGQSARRAANPASSVAAR